MKKLLLGLIVALVCIGIVFAQGTPQQPSQEDCDKKFEEVQKVYDTLKAYYEEKGIALPEIPSELLSAVQDMGCGIELENLGVNSEFLKANLVSQGISLPEELNPNNAPQNNENQEPMPAAQGPAEPAQMNGQANGQPNYGQQVSQCEEEMKKIKDYVKALEALLAENNIDYSGVKDTLEAEHAAQSKDKQEQADAQQQNPPEGQQNPPEGQQNPPEEDPQKQQQEPKQGKMKQAFKKVWAFFGLGKDKQEQQPVQ
jgi:hypothetical protein